MFKIVDNKKECSSCHQVLDINLFPKTKKTKNGLQADCHTTGKIRGLLCGNCNTALGLVKDSQDTLKAMLQYLST